MQCVAGRYAPSPGSAGKGKVDRSSFIGPFLWGGQGLLKSAGRSQAAEIDVCGTEAE